VGVKHPKPTFHGKTPPVYGPFLEWAERQLDGVLSDALPTLASRFAALSTTIAAIGTSLSSALVSISGLETRIDDLEGVETGARTVTLHAMLQSVAVAGERWIAPWEDSPGLNAGTERTRLIMGAAGSVVALYVKIMGGSPGAAGRTTAFYLEKNGVDQAMTVTVPADESPPTLRSTTSNSFTFVAGDEISFKFENDSSTSIAGPQDYAITAVLRYS
jgi:hypothetical protein